MIYGCQNNAWTKSCGSKSKHKPDIGVKGIGY